MREVAERAEVNGWLGLRFVREGSRRTNAARWLVGSAILCLLRLCAVLATLVRYVALRQRYPAALEILGRCEGTAWSSLYRTTLGHLVRRSLTFGPLERSDLLLRRGLVLEGEHRLPRGGCVLAFLHSPWLPRLTRLVVEHEVRVVAGGRWSAALSELRTSRGVADLKDLSRTLKRGGRVALSVDNFDERGACALDFLGVPVRFDPGALRLASLAGVPVLPIDARLEAGRLRVRIGRPIRVDRHRSCAQPVLRLLRHFEASVREDPMCWSRLHRFCREHGSLSKRAPLPADPTTGPGS